MRHLETGRRRGRRLLAAMSAAALLAALITGVGCFGSRSTRRQDLPAEVREQADEIARYCPRCDKIVIFTREELEAMPGDEPLLIKARKAKCPTCETAETTEALRCRHCGTYCPPPHGTAKGRLRCPRCGKKPT